MAGKHRKKSRRIPYIIIACFLVILVGGVFVLLSRDSSQPSSAPAIHSPVPYFTPEVHPRPESTVTSQPATTPVPTPRSIEVQSHTAAPTQDVSREIAQTRTLRVSAAGDCTLGGEKATADRFMRLARKKGLGYFLGGVRDIFSEDDLTIVNLEGPLTNETKARKGRAYNFRGNPGYVEILTQGSVEACNIANNHALDYLEAGLAETKRTLSDAGIVWCGYEDAGIFVAVNGLRVGLLGYHLGTLKSSESAFAAISALREECDIVIVSMHSGVEGSHSATSKQRRFAHGAVEAGADLVLGHHPHVIGPIEVYKGVNIVYSLANFCFGGNANPKDKRTFIFQVTFEVEGDGTVRTREENVIPCFISSKSNTNDFCPTPCSKQAAKGIFRLLKKISPAKSTLDFVTMYKAMESRY